MTMPDIILPQLIVEAGLVPDSPVQAGGVLRLDDVTSGLLDTATLGTAIMWADISAWVLAFSVTRPSTRQQGPLYQFQAGTASITLDNSDGRFDPDNLSGPYVSAGITQLSAMVPVRIRASFRSAAYSLYSGFADGWLPAQVSYEGGYAELALPATDAFKVLAGITLAPAASAGAGEDAGARVNRVLNAAGWYTSGDRRNVNTGSSAVQATTLGDTALNLMQAAADAEIGQLYVDGTGAVTFRARHALLSDARSATVQAVFGDLPGTVQAAGAELPYMAVTRASDDTTIANDVQATRNGGALQEVTDAASIRKYLFPRTFNKTGLILTDDPTTLNWAQWVLYVSARGEDRFESLQVDPQADPVSLWPQVLGREVGDRIQAWQRPAGAPSPVSKDCFIAGITHSWDSASRSWLTTWTLQDASKYGSFLTLDNPALGALDANALAF